MSAKSVSLIVPSQGRPTDLTLCLLAVEQLNHTNFEVIVVADRAGLDALGTIGMSERIKAVPFHETNISQARNAGIENASGDIIAFIDDDAVPEPAWLCALTDAFESGVGYATGLTLGPDGVSAQYPPRLVDFAAQHTPMSPRSDVHVVEPALGQALKAEGTNCAFDAAALRALGGFDPAFRFYLDDADLNLRFAQAGYRAAFSAEATVHHRFTASDRRTKHRVPRSLTEIGASTAYYLRKHADGAVASELNVARASQRLRLIRHMVAGRCEPRDVRRLLESFDQGVLEGLARPISTSLSLRPSARSFKRFEPRVKFEAHEMVAGSGIRRRHLRSAAGERVKNGSRVTLVLKGLPLGRERTAFTASGYWEHRVGVFQPSKPATAVEHWQPLHKRVPGNAAGAKRSRTLA
ncbi:MAG: glycosyltransferase [Pseudomonadota bacterium]